MKLGDVLKKERERRKLSVEEIASRLDLSADEYNQIETGNSPLEEWGPQLGRVAIKLRTPTSRLISAAGKSADARKVAGQCGTLIKHHREIKGLGQNELAQMLDVPVAKIISIENGESPLETYGPLLLGVAEVFEQPVFNLLYPCGLPLEKLNDYP